MSKRLHLLLADDDTDNRFFFDKALSTLSIPTELTTVEDGEKLMTCLYKNPDQLPDIIFLDLNMPRKSGSECLEEIKQNEKFKHLPVVIYSSSLHEDVADLLYKKGAHHYLRKGSLEELAKTLNTVLSLMVEKKFGRPLREQFILS